MIVDAVLVRDQRPHETTELQQCMPITPVAGQTRSLDGHHGADAAFTYRRQKLLETRTSDPRAGAAEIVVDHADIGPTELSGAFHEGILSPAAFDVVDDLADGRLPDVDDCPVLCSSRHWPPLLARILRRYAAGSSLIEHGNGDEHEGNHLGLARQENGTR